MIYTYFIWWYLVKLYIILWNNKYPNCGVYYIPKELEQIDNQNIKMKITRVITRPILSM